MKRHRHDDPIQLPGDDLRDWWVSPLLWVMMLAAWGCVVGFWAAFLWEAI